MTTLVPASKKLQQVAVKDTEALKQRIAKAINDADSFPFVFPIGTVPVENGKLKELQQWLANDGDGYVLHQELTAMYSEMGRSVDAYQLRIDFHFRKITNVQVEEI